MGKFMMIPNRNRLAESIAIARKYDLGFEFNDFWNPKNLDHEDYMNSTVAEYLEADLPELRTNHGDFFDVLIFSEDTKIREIARERILQSMDASVRIGAKGVVFHTNYTPALRSEGYQNNWIRTNERIWREMLRLYPDQEIYVENMFDEEPDLLVHLAERMEDQDRFGICLDYAHAATFGRDLRQWVERTAPYVKHVHINDNDLREDLHLAVGDGKIDWQQFAADYHRYYEHCTTLIEVSDLAKLQRSLAYLEKLGLVAAHEDR